MGGKTLKPQNRGAPEREEKRDNLFKKREKSRKNKQEGTGRFFQFFLVVLFSEEEMDEVRATAAWVASRSSHVKVDMLGEFFSFVFCHLP